MLQIAIALESIALGLGVSVRTSTKVDAVNVNAAGNASSIVLSDGAVLSFDVVISNVDLPVNYTMLKQDQAEDLKGAVED